MIKQILKIMRNLLLLLIILIVIGSATLFIYRQVRANQILKANAITSSEGIDTEEVVKIGGIDQYLYIRGQNKNNPVILFLHGGPGSPMTPLIYKYQLGLENQFTVVNWDQRNAGKTYFLNDHEVVKETLTFERIVEDTKEVTEYLLTKFNQDKIIILGHSWGTAIGTAFVQKYPELVQAYIGTGQVINAASGDELAFQTALVKAKEANKQKDIEVMESLTHYQLTDQEFSIKAFSTARMMTAKYLSPSIKDTTTKDLFFSPYYSLKDMSYFLKNTFDIQKPLMDYLIFDYDTTNYGTEYQVPVFYILGDEDWVTPTVTAKTFFDQINAPIKELIIIEKAGHMTMIDQPDIYCDAVKNVINKIK